MRYVETLFQLSLARAQLFQTIILSEEYKLHKTHKSRFNADGFNESITETDGDRLKECIATMRRHLEQATEYAQTIAELNIYQYGNCNKDKP